MKVVERIAGETNIAKIDFSDILPSQVIMTLTITATHSKTAPLEPASLARALKGCQEATELDNHRNNVYLYLQSRMSIFCPNLATLLSAELAAKLVTAAGGLKALATMPSENIMQVGQMKKNSFGMAGHAYTAGMIYQSDLIIGAKSEHRGRAIRYIRFRSPSDLHLRRTSCSVYVLRMCIIYLQGTASDRIFTG